jgi:hypothetical protein
MKVTDDAFPCEAIRQAGYHAAVFGQKTYNGVAILSKVQPQNIQLGMPGFEDPQARLLMAEIKGIWIVSAYVPNGESVGSEKYRYKLRWLQRLREFMEARLRSPWAFVFTRIRRSPGRPRRKGSFSRRTICSCPASTYDPAWRSTSDGFKEKCSCWSMTRRTALTLAARYRSSGCGQLASCSSPPHNP